MNTTFTAAIDRRRWSRWGHLRQSIAIWQHQSRSRNELESLSDATLRDIGISRCDAHREADKFFWMT